MFNFLLKFPGGTEIHKSLKIYLKWTNYNSLLRHMCTQMPVVLDTKAKLLLWLCSNVGHSLPVQFYIFSSHKRGKLCLKLGLVLQAIPIILLFCLIIQELEVGANPVQVETGEFDEAIEVVEDVIAESEFDVFSTPPLPKFCTVQRCFCCLHHVFCPCI